MAASSIWKGILARTGGGKAILPARAQGIPAAAVSPQRLLQRAPSRRSVLGARTPLVDERDDDQTSATRAQGGFCKTSLHGDGNRRRVVRALSSHACAGDQQMPLHAHFVIDSRGGKISGAHLILDSCRGKTNMFIYWLSIPIGYYPHYLGMENLDVDDYWVWVRVTRLLPNGIVRCGATTG